jgi:hypothetical protein
MPEELTDAFILEQKKVTRSHFVLDDLIGKTIRDHRLIKNPRKCNPEKESPNPEYFDVLVFNDNTFLMTECWGDGECGHLRYYFYNGQKTSYSDRLFGIL